MQMRHYWEKNAPATCAVLTVVVALSALIRPISWQLLLGTGAGGCLLYIANEFSERNRELLGAALAILGLLIAVWAMAVSGVIRGPLMWVQGIGTVFATSCGCMVFVKAIREDSTESE